MVRKFVARENFILTRSDFENRRFLNVYRFTRASVGPRIFLGTFGANFLNRVLRIVKGVLGIVAISNIPFYELVLKIGSVSREF